MRVCTENLLPVFCNSAMGWLFAYRRQKLGYAMLHPNGKWRAPKSTRTHRFHSEQGLILVLCDHSGLLSGTHFVTWCAIRPCSSLPLRLVFFSFLVSYHVNDFEQHCFNYMALCTSSCGNLSPKIHLLVFILRHQISQRMDSWTNSTLPNAATKHMHWEINLKPKGTKRENSALQN